MAVKETNFVQVLSLRTSNVTRFGPFKVIYDKIVSNFASCRTLKPIFYIYTELIFIFETHNSYQSSTVILQTFVHRDKLLILDNRNDIYNLRGKYVVTLSTAVLPKRTSATNINFVSYKNRLVCKSSFIEK